MRTKNEILAATMEDIRNEVHKPDAPLWLEARKIEVLIDIRDILHTLLNEDQVRSFKLYQLS